MVTGGGWAISAGEKPGWGLGKVEEVTGKVLARGIKVWWPEGEIDGRGRRRRERSSGARHWSKNDEEERGYDRRVLQLG